jgi:hypothetical protein
LKNFTIRPKYQNYKDTKCIRRNATEPIAEDPRCCGDHDGFYKMYFASKNCCEEDGKIRTIGECFEDVGIPYTAKVQLCFQCEKQSIIQINIYRPEYEQNDNSGGKDTSTSTSSDSGSSEEDKNSSNGTGGGSGSSKPNKWEEETNELEGNL